jgi:hypothetical protein
MKDEKACKRGTVVHVVEHLVRGMAQTNRAEVQVCAHRQQRHPPVCSIRPIPLQGLIFCTIGRWHSGEIGCVKKEKVSLVSFLANEPRGAIPPENSDHKSAKAREYEASTLLLLGPESTTGQGAA